MTNFRAFACVLMLVPGACYGQEAVRAATKEIAAKDGAAKVSDQQFMKMTEDLLAAEVREDPAAMDKVLTASYTHTHAAGRQQSRAEFMADFVPGTHKYKGADIFDLLVRSYGSSALVSGGEHIHVDGPNGDHYYKFTAFWVQDRGQWRVAAWVTSTDPKNLRVP
jgi:hypothetical protein